MSCKIYKRSFLQLLKPLEVHRDGQFIIDSNVLLLSDEDTHFDRLSLRLSKAPKHGNLFETIHQPLVADVNNSTTIPSLNRRKIAEGEEISASLIMEGRLRYINIVIFLDHSSKYAFIFLLYLISVIYKMAQT